MEHAELVAEMPYLERLGAQERLQLSKRKRQQQLKKWTQQEKEWSKKHKTENKENRPRRIRFNNAFILLEAASRNDLNEVKSLLVSGLHPDLTNEDGMTALHQAAIDNNEEMVKLLLDFKANPNAEDFEKWTPLHAAVFCGNLRATQCLISRGANLLAVNADGYLPFGICDNSATLDLIEGEMKRRGITQIDIDDARLAPENLMLKNIQQAAASGADLNAVDSENVTFLHVAAANNYISVVKFLLDRKVSVNVEDNEGWQPIHAAAHWENMDILSKLVQAGADLKARTHLRETPADLCEDQNMRKNILALESEQNNNTVRHVVSTAPERTRGVRRTSQRDKSLLTKKDALGEARLRLDSSIETSEGAYTEQQTVESADGQLQEENLELPMSDPEEPLTETTVGTELLPRTTEPVDKCEEATNMGTVLAFPKTNVSLTVSVTNLSDLKKQKAQSPVQPRPTNSSNQSEKHAPKLDGTSKATVNHAAERNTCCVIL